MRRKQSLIAILVGALIASPLAFAKTTDPPGDALLTAMPADTLVLSSDAPPTYGGLSTVTVDADALAITKPADDANKYVLKSTGAKTIGLTDDRVKSMLGSPEVRPTGTILAKLTSELKADGLHDILAKKANSELKVAEPISNGYERWLTVPKRVSKLGTGIIIGGMTVAPG